MPQVKELTLYEKGFLHGYTRAFSYRGSPGRCGNTNARYKAGYYDGVQKYCIDAYRWVNSYYGSFHAYDADKANATFAKLATRINDTLGAI
jgi:hypothetical protein